jgi:hypothetical protein
MRPAVALFADVLGGMDVQDGTREESPVVHAAPPMTASDALKMDLLPIAEQTDAIKILPAGATTAPDHVAPAQVPAACIGAASGGALFGADEIDAAMGGES